ncbi:hypothetical protein [Oceanisphaera profunda]|nr:hypothetical protein [Oceanisphaera profunda]
MIYLIKMADDSAELSIKIVLILANIGDSFMIFMLILAGLLCGGFCYVGALYSALPPRRWALLGAIFGPAIFPLLMAKRRWSLVCARGLNDDLFLA